MCPGPTWFRDAGDRYADFHWPPQPCACGCCLCGHHGRQRTGMGPGQRLSHAPDHADRALPRRRLHRPPHAHPGRHRGQAAGPDHHRGEQARRGRHAGPGQHVPHGQARWLHHHPVPHVHAAHGAHAKDGLEPGHGLHLHHRRLGLHLRLHGALGLALQELQRIHCRRAQEPRQDRVRLHRHRLLAPPADGGTGRERQGHAQPRALQGQRRPAAGPAGRPRGRAKRCLGLGHLCGWRPDAPAHDLRRKAHPALARCAHGQGAGLWRGLHLALRTGRPQGHGPGRGAQAARRLQESHG